MGAANDRPEPALSLPKGAPLVAATAGRAHWRWGVRCPEGRFEDQAFLCTDRDATPTQILAWVVLRWNIEVTFEDVREHLGVETQRQWSDKAIARTTPILLGLYSLITLLAHEWAK